MAINLSSCPGPCPVCGSPCSAVTCDPVQSTQYDGAQRDDQFQGSFCDDSVGPPLPAIVTTPHLIGCTRIWLPVRNATGVPCADANFHWYADDTSLTLQDLGFFPAGTYTLNPSVHCRMNGTVTIDRIGDWWRVCYDITLASWNPSVHATYQFSPPAIGSFGLPRMIMIPARTGTCCCARYNPCSSGAPCVSWFQSAYAIIKAPNPCSAGHLYGDLYYALCANGGCF